MGIKAATQAFVLDCRESVTELSREMDMAKAPAPAADHGLLLGH
jgi:hypothetical protein